MRINLERIGGAMKKPKLYLGNLQGPEGNAFVMLGRARRVMLDAGREEEWEKINAEATSGDYENLIKVLGEHFELEYVR